MAEIILQEEGSTPATPGSGKWKAYFKASGLFIIDDAGAESGPLGAGSFSPTITSAALGNLVFYDGSAWRNIGGLKDGEMINGKIAVSVTSNNITVALKTRAGADASATDPIIVNIKGSYRLITSALSVTKNAATNWCNSGSAELATKEIDYFAYLIWNTTPATDVVDIGFSRIPYGRVFNDFSTTTTNEKYLAYGNASQPTGTDDVINIGRFAATLSASASFNWSVPTFTNVNLIQEPIFESRILDFVPTVTPSAGTRASVVVTFDKYQVKGREFSFYIYETWNQQTTAADYVQFTIPFTPSLGPNFSGIMTGAGVTSSNVTSSGNSVYVRRYDGAAGVFTTGASKDVRMTYTAALP